MTSDACLSMPARRVSDVTHDELLMPPWWWWLAAIAGVSIIGGAMVVSLPTALAIGIVAVLAAAVVAMLWLYGNTRVRVDEQALHVGDARIEFAWLAQAEALLGDDAAKAVNAAGHAGDFVVTKPYLSDVVKVTLDDPADPHPHWIVSSRRAAELAQAVNAALSPQG